MPKPRYKIPKCFPTYLSKLAELSKRTLEDGAKFWEKGHPRNHAVSCQKLYGSNKKWKQNSGDHKQSQSKTAMYRVKLLLGASLTLRNYNARVGESYAMIKALNKPIGLGMP